MFPGKSKFAKLNKLYVPMPGSTLSFSRKTYFQESFRSEARNQLRSTWPFGARGSGGATAPKACNCPRVNKPLLIRTWPAGVACPATLLLYLLMTLLRLPALIPRSKFPKCVPGIGSCTVPSPVKSVRKISP